MHTSKPPCLILSAVQVLLLDEITVDMDVVGRLDLLQFFKQECAERGATIIYVRRGGRLHFSRTLLRLALFRLGMLSACTWKPSHAYTPQLERSYRQHDPCPKNLSHQDVLLCPPAHRPPTSLMGWRAGPLTLLTSRTAACCGVGD